MAAGVQRSRWSDPGGIVALADLIDAHRGAFEYDWRARFHLPLTVVGKSMQWGEAYRLTRLLSLDPSSAVSAALNEFDRPTPREALVLMDLYDLVHQSKSRRRVKRYPRPWADQSRKVRGRTRLTREQLRALLDRHRLMPATGETPPSIEAGSP